MQQIQFIRCSNIWGNSLHLKLCNVLDYLYALLGCSPASESNSRSQGFSGHSEAKNRCLRPSCRILYNAQGEQ